MQGEQGSVVAVIGLGKIGLALAGFYLQRGLIVRGCDIARERLQRVADTDVARREPELSEPLHRGLAAGRLYLTQDAADAVRGATTTIVIVPAGLDEAGVPDLAALESVAHAIIPSLEPDGLVIVETTVPVGTTRRVFGERVAERNRRDDLRIGVAFSAERVSVGRVFRDLETYPKIVGGLTPQDGARASAFYAGHLGAEVRDVGSLETAEFVKLIETTYRYVNIGLANEFALAAEAHGIDITVAIAAANSQPYSHVHAPGLGVGGHCIPVYPSFFEAGAPRSDIVRAARLMNDKIVEHAVERLRDALGDLDGRRVLILGVAFRPGVKEAAWSPALRLARELVEAGAIIAAVDPLFSDDELAALGLAPLRAGEGYEAAVLATAHPEFLDCAILRRARPTVVLDGRNALDASKVRALGIRYMGIGR